MTTPTPRHREAPLALLRRTAGSPREMVAKGARLVGVLGTYRSGRGVRARLRRLRVLGHVERVPTRIQLAVGAADMMRFFINPAAADYYLSQGLDYWFHITLRFLDDPSSLADPLGLFSTRDAIIGHLMQVVHANPVYDLQLLSAFDGGLDELEKQIQELIEGTHPRAKSIGAIIEEADYHARLLAFVRAWRRDPHAPAPLRSNVAANPLFSEMERTFGSLTTAMRYFCRLPSTPLGALRHLRTVKEFPSHLGEAPLTPLRDRHATP
jgi:hypothetical protein